jgi:lysine 6-dehydrogenase
VGGIPKVKTPPLDYQTVYTLESVFKVYNRPAKIYVDGKLTEVEPLTGYEIINFPDPIGNLEAYFTDGLASLPITMEGKVSGRLEEKTLRYPGFVEKVKFLKECGFLEDKEIEINNVKIKPIDVFVKILGSKLELGPDGDILAMRVIVSGKKDGKSKGYVYELVDYFDPESGYTSMARTTGLPAAVAARMIAMGRIQEKGVVFPESLFKDELYDILIQELMKYNINIKMINS